MDLEIIEVDNATFVLLLYFCLLVFYQVLNHSWQAKNVRGGSCERKERKEENVQGVEG